MIDKQTFELVLDVISVVAGGIFLSLTIAGVFSWAATAWSIGLFTGWLGRHLLH